LVRGDAGSLTQVTGSYLGPTLRLRRGERVRISFANALAEATTIHWHGLRVPSDMDGHPQDAVAPGASFAYEFDVLERAGTYWYHPHVAERAGPQVYAGLAGVLLVSDEEEDRLALPSGPSDLLLVLQDRTFDRNNQFVYPARGMMGAMEGALGETVLVNGMPNAALDVATRAYRLRLLNGSNARIYKLAWRDATPLSVIGTDGGLLETPVSRDYVMLAPGERVEIIADFRRRKVGARPSLVSLAFSAAGGMGMGGGRLPNGAAFDVLRFRVRRRERDTFELPAKLSTIERYDPASAVNATAPRTLPITFDRMRWLLNGRPFEPNGLADNETVRFGTLEVWEFRNDAAGMMGSMPHPIHVHGVQFQVAERAIAPAAAAAWETVRAGYVDEGWKDTVLLMPGELVRLLVKFRDYPGLYVYHCHNLEHEDAGMMRNFLIR